MGIPILLRLDKRSGDVCRKETVYHNQTWLEVGRGGNSRRLGHGRYHYRTLLLQENWTICPSDDRINCATSLRVGLGQYAGLRCRRIPSNTCPPPPNKQLNLDSHDN